MNPDNPTIITVLVALVGIISLLVGALVWFLKRLIDKTIPEMLGVFQAEMKHEREECQKEHVDLLESQQKHYREWRESRGQP